MLQKMRSFSKSIVSSIFMGVIALSFVVWGIADIFRGRTDTNVATVGSVEISYDTFSRDYRNFVRNRSQQAGHEITQEEARKLGLPKASLEAVLNRTAIDNVIAGLGLTSSDADVSARVRTMQVFNGPLGTFDKPTFDRVLARQGFSEGEFVEAVRGDMTRNQLLSPVEDGFQVPAGYAHALFAYSTELRAAEYIILSPQILGPVQMPTPQEMAAYVKANPGRFSTPEYRNVTVAAIGIEDVTPSIKVTDAQIKQEYENRKAAYVVAEKRDIEQINFKTEEAAGQARAQIDGGKSFAAVALANGTKPSDIALGTLVAADLDKARADAAFALPENGVSQPVKTAFGWALLHVTKITPGVSKTLDDVKPELTKYLTDQLAQSKLVDMENAYSDAFSNGDEIAEAAKKAGMRIIHVKAVDPHGMAPDGSKTALPDDPDLLPQIFNADVGETGDPFQTKAGHVFVISVEGVTPPKVKPLESVRMAALAAMIAERRRDEMRKRAAEIAAEAQRNGDLVAVAQKLGVPILFGPALGRDQASNVFSQVVVGRLFRVPYHGIVNGPNAAGNAYVVARVTGVTHPPLSPNDPNFRMGERQLAGQIAGDITDALARAARMSQGEHVNQKLFEQAVGSSEGS
jgi:peptidyl-prolyl cis-trans isomerase D